MNQSIEPYRQASFLLSAPKIHDLPSDVGREVMMLGRSNVGKSSFINAICGQKSLAQTSKTPGRTRFLNVFLLEEGKRLVDAPGYGFARVAKPESARWRLLLEQYITTRKCLGLVVLLMDIRHPLQEQDIVWLDFLHAHDVPTWVVLNKKDALGYGKQVETQRKVFNYCHHIGMNVQVSLVSAQKKLGLEPLLVYLKDKL
ncbi:MAG: ribosome biogenesis GTP-binding protein YihA/YsxC [Pseudomonadota bacterium]|nr:ribosome biogenesis GTP-binding protein YihA/YsxC [Pseudomonadota bacterium]